MKSLRILNIANIGFVFLSTCILLRAQEFVSTGEMLSARAYHTSTLLPNGKVLVTGWWGSAELYDPFTGTFTATGPIPNWSSDQNAVLLYNGQVLLTGSRGTGGNSLYDPDSETFIPTGNRQYGSCYSNTAILLQNGKVLVTGCNYQAELYDPTTGTFSITGDMNEDRTSFSAILLMSGHVLIVSGYDGSGGLYGSAELYDPATGSFSYTGNINVPRRGSESVLLPDGTVLITGGQVAGGPGFEYTTQAELYDPVTGTFSLTGNMAVGRAYHTITLLADGNVLITGGVGNGEFNFLGSAEIYDPSAGAFSLVDNMLIARYGHAATLLTSGDVLVSGGYGPGGEGVLLSSAELFTSPSSIEFVGFLPPIGGTDSTGGNFANPLRTFKMGSTIPVKFGAFINDAPVLTGVHFLQAIQFSEKTNSDIPIDATAQDVATLGNQFRLVDDQWHLDTRATGMSVGIWQLIATLSDGCQHSVWIQLK